MLLSKLCVDLVGQGSRVADLVSDHRDALTASGNFRDRELSTGEVIQLRVLFFKLGLRLSGAEPIFPPNSVHEILGRFILDAPLGFSEVLGEKLADIDVQVQIAWALLGHRKLQGGAVLDDKCATGLISQIGGLAASMKLNGVTEIAVTSQQFPLALAS